MKTLRIITFMLVAFLLLTNTQALALEKCKERVIPNSECVILTPPTKTQGYSIINMDTGITILNGTLENVSNNIKKFVFNQTSKGSYLIALNNNITVREIIVEGEDDMAGLAITLFIMAITAAFFILPFKFTFYKESVFADFVLKRGSILFGLFLLSLDTAMVATIASNAGIDVTRELFRYLWIIQWGTYVFIVVLFVQTIKKGLALWKLQKAEKRMGKESGVLFG